MSNWLEVGLGNALAALLLAVPAALVARRSRRPALAHALWLLVLLKLITPPLVRWPLPWPVPVAAAAEPTPPLSPAVPEAGAERLPAEPLSPVPVPAAVADGFPSGEESGPRAPAPAGREWPRATILGAVWLTGSVGWFLLALVRVRRFQRELRRAVPAPEALRARVRTLAARLGLRRYPDLWLIHARVVPLLWWVGGPARLVVPAGLVGRLHAEELDALLLHKLAHYRRRDHWVRAVEFAALGLYWWHPATWYARRALREAEEQCCDAWVVTALPGSARRYATALVTTLDYLAGADPVPAGASGMSPVDDLKQRLTMILRDVPPRALSRRAALLVLCLGSLLPLLPARGRPVGGEDGPVEVAASEAAGAAEEDAEVRKARAELARVTAETEAAKARLRQATDDGDRKGAATQRLTVHIEIAGVDPGPEELKAILGWVEKELPGSDPRLFLLHPREVRSAADRRVRELEQRIDAVVREIESLRRELRKLSAGPPPRPAAP